jgi:hypothetical protein
MRQSFKVGWAQPPAHKAYRFHPTVKQSLVVMFFEGTTGSVVKPDQAVQRLGEQLRSAGDARDFQKEHIPTVQQVKSLFSSLASEWKSKQTLQGQATPYWQARQVGSSQELPTE